MFGRAKVALMVGEFVSAAVLSMVVLSMIGRTSFPFFAALAAGASVALMAYLFSAHSNPAVTIGLWTMRKVPTTEGIVRVATQMLGGLAAWQLVEYLLNDQVKNLAGNAFDWRVLVAEAVGAFVLGMGVAVAITRAYTPSANAIAGGASLFLGILLASFASNGIVNPAVALGVQSWSWAYGLGPILGAVVGMTLYSLIFVEGAPKLRSTTIKSRASSKSAKRPNRRSTSRSTTSRSRR